MDEGIGSGNDRLNSRYIASPFWISFTIFVTLNDAGIILPNIDCLSRLEALILSTIANLFFGEAQICDKSMQPRAKASFEGLTGRPVLGVSRNRPCWSVDLAIAGLW